MFVHHSLEVVKCLSMLQDSMHGYLFCFSGGQRCAFNLNDES